MIARLQENQLQIQSQLQGQVQSSFAHQDRVLITISFEFLTIASSTVTLAFINLSKKLTHWTKESPVRSSRLIGRSKHSTEGLT